MQDCQVMEYDQVCVYKRVLLIWQFGEGLSEEVVSELRPDIRKNQWEVPERKPIQIEEIVQRPEGKSEEERTCHAQETDERSVWSFSLR